MLVITFLLLSLFTADFYRGPPLHNIPPPMHESIVLSCLNVISLKVHESDEGYPINVFGTVVARDQVDFRCVYLFRRESDDSQFISSRVCIFIPYISLTVVIPSL